MSDELSLEYDKGWLVDSKQCQHKRVLIRKEEHLVYCALCQSVLDPFNVLLVFMRDWKFAYEAIQRHYQDTAERKLKWEKERYWPPEDREKPHQQIFMEHSKNGCPRLWMQIGRVYITCYCGVSMNRKYYPDLEREVVEAKARKEGHD